MCVEMFEFAVSGTFCSAMVIISEDVLVTGLTDEAGRKEACNYD